MKVLLTGPTGFIGSAFARLALGRGHQLAGLIVPGEAVPSNWPAGTDVTWLRGTLEQAPWAEIKAFGAELCVHTAWITTPGVYLESPDNDRFRDASLEFVRRLWDLGTRHIVGLGTCIEYQITDRPLSEETTPSAPTTRYARCKNELRLALSAEAGARGLPFCWGRVFYPYGPGEHPSRLASSIIRKLAQGEKIELKTPASTKDYIYIEDLAAALLTVVERRYSGLINLGTGEGIAVREVAGVLGRLMGRPELIAEAEKLQPDPFPLVVADAGKLHGLGWRSEWPIERGLERLVATLGRSSKG
jgi:nucleoside-diphosphate-sugar epimerase